MQFNVNVTWNRGCDSDDKKFTYARYYELIVLVAARSNAMHLKGLYGSKRPCLLNHALIHHYETCQAHGSVFLGVRPVTERSPVQTPLWSIDVVCCALRHGTLSTLSQSNHLKWTPAYPGG